MVNFHTNTEMVVLYIFFFIAYIILFAKLLYVSYFFLIQFLKGSRHGFSYSTLAPIQAWEINAP